MPNYKTSSGQSIDKKKIDKNISEAKKKYLESFIDEYDFYYCERTKRVDLGLDCSHIISVKECQNSGRSELAWCIFNLELLNRDEHNEIEKWSNQTREDWYHRRKEGMEFEEFKLFNNL